MDIKRAKQEIKNAVTAYLARDDAGDYLIPAVRQRPILLMGPPGVGKTQIMEQIARECGIGLVAYTITHHTRQSAVGLPFIRQKQYGGQQFSVTEYTMSEIIASVYEQMEKTRRAEGILFIDEINCVSETLAPTMLQFLQCKTFGNQAVPPGWVIVAAGNPPEYNKAVRDFDMVTLDRVRRIDIEPNLAVWQEYARTRRLHPAVPAFLELRPQHFYKVENTVDGLQFVTARGWEDLSAMLTTSEALGLPTDEEVIGQYLRHPESARDFAAYWSLYKKYRQDYGVEEILQGHPADAAAERALAASFDERLSLVSLLLAGLNVRFAAARTADAVTDFCYQQLRAYKRALAAGQSVLPGGTAAGLNRDPGEGDPSPAERFAAQRAELQARLAEGGKADRFTPAERKVHAAAMALLREWGGLVTARDTPDEAFDHLRAGFNRQVHRREDAVADAGAALEAAFDFMERVFGEEQEMVVFVNELALGPDSAPYLAENECERFERYSRRLLLKAGRDELLAELDRAELRQGEHSRDF